MIYDLEVKIEDYKLPSTQFEGRGKHCFIYDCPDWVKVLFGLEEKKVLLKVFRSIPINDNTDISKLKWGDDPVGDNPRRNANFINATRIQNIAHMNGLAPRVYGLCTAIYDGKKVVVQITDDVRGKVENEQKGIKPRTKPIANFVTEHKDAEPIYEKVIQLGNEYGFEVDKKDVSKWDVVNGQLLDFQTFDFNEKYLEKIRKIYKDGTKWGKIYYHAIPELGLSGGPRKMDKRIEEMRLEDIDFEGKTVLDLGCSGGLFINYALEHGATKAVGIDFPDAVEGARLASNHLGYFNADYYGMDLQKETTDSIRKATGVEKFDIVFYLSMFRHIHFPSFVWEMCKETAIIEWNNWKTEESGEIKEMVKEKFEIKREGRTTDHGTGKPFYICEPNN